MSFRGKTAIITGGASGMGLLCAQTLAADGARVVLTDVNAKAVESAAQAIRADGGDALAIRVDVRDYTQIEHAVTTAVETYGTIDFLLNCAGGAETRVLNCPEPFHQQPVALIDWGLDVNLKGTVYFSRAVFPTMVQHKRGVIITLGSVTGVEGSDRAVCYSAAKSGMIGLTKSLALCGAPYNIRACCVSPGPVLTRPGMASMKTRLGRAAEPEEVVDLILYLCSDKASFITGANYLIDGGRTCGGI